MGVGVLKIRLITYLSVESLKNWLINDKFMSTECTVRVYDLVPNSSLHCNFDMVNYTIGQNHKPRLSAYIFTVTRKGLSVPFDCHNLDIWESVLVQTCVCFLKNMTNVQIIAVYYWLILRECHGLFRYKVLSINFLWYSEILTLFCLES